MNENTAEGRYVIEVWDADIGPGELLAVAADALAAHGTKHGRVRVSFTDRAIPPTIGTAS